MPKIKVSDKALGHLSRGLYRSPASAIRELVSNAWDANATVVHISTNYPNFHQLSIEDNGDGFTEEQFVKLMSGGIGNSGKRIADVPSKHKRPIIGRLGIGMLGIAQICGSFTITSKPREGKAFKARIHLFDLLKERLDDNDQEIVGEVQDDSDVSMKVVNIGDYNLEEDFDTEAIKYGTSIISDDVHPTFVRSFQNSLKFEKFKRPPLDWEKALKIVSSVHSLQELGDYWRLLWELSAASPLPYISKKALPNQVVFEDQKRLEQYNFKVIVDGIQLFKPVDLQDNPAGYTIKKIEEQVKRVYGKDVRFHGYILVQEGTQLKPDELRGIMIRIKNVGIGYYDSSMLDYRINHGPRSRWITGEIYVDEGLEDSLNIDRDSFNRFHPEFKVIQEYVHKVLQEDIFPEVYKQIDVRSKAKEKKKEKDRVSYLQETIANELEIPVKIFYGTDGDNNTTQVELNHKKNSLEIYLPEGKLKTKKTASQLAKAVLAIYEISGIQKTKEKQRDLFYRMLLTLLAKW